MSGGDGLDWFPSEYCDEVMPSARASADAWIVESGGKHYLAPCDPCDGAEVGPLLADGDVIEFTTCEVHAEIGFALRAGKPVFALPPPPGFEQCCVMNGWQMETLATDVDEMISMLREADGGDGDYVASFYTFADAGPFRFDAGKRSFEKVVGRT